MFILPRPSQLLADRTCWANLRPLRGTDIDMSVVLPSTRRSYEYVGIELRSMLSA